MQIIGKDSFKKEILEHKGLAVVEFFATWCGHCQRFAPTWEALVKEYHGKVKMAQVDVDKNEDLINEYRISGTPTLIYFKDGEKVDTTVGEITKEEFAAHIDKL